MAHLRQKNWRRSSSSCGIVRFGPVASKQRPCPLALSAHIGRGAWAHLLNGLEYCFAFGNAGERASHRPNDSRCAVSEENLRDEAWGRGCLKAAVGPRLAP